MIRINQQNWNVTALKGEHFLQREYWLTLTESIGTWIVREVLVWHTLANIAAVIVSIILAILIARSIKPKLADFIEKRILGGSALHRFLTVLEQILTYVIAIILLWVALVAFRRLGFKIYFLDAVESLLIAWVSIRLLSSIVRQTFLSRAIAVIAWSVAALHILSLLDPTLVLLDRAAVSIGDARLSILLIIKSVILLSLLVWMALGAAAILGKRVTAIERLSPSMQIFLSKVITIILTLAAVMITISALGIDLSAFAFIGGAVGLGIGFGLQKVVSNLFSGLILLVDRSIKPGDVIAIDDTYGRIRTMGARYVSIVTRDGTEYLIPNEDLITRQVVNWSFSSTVIRIKLGVSVSYDSDVHQVMELMVAAAGNTDRVLDDPPPICQLKDFGNFGIDFELRFWIRDPQNGIANVSSAVRLEIWDAFNAHGIEIPLPQQVVHMAKRKAEKDRRG